jgi:hypothetical protein
MVEPNKSGLGPRASRRLVLLQADKLVEAAHEEGRRLTGAQDPISPEALFQRILPAKPAPPTRRLRRNVPAPIPALARAFWLVVLAILVTTTGPLE